MASNHTSSSETARRPGPKGRSVSAASIVAFCLILFGWWTRDERDLVASEGAGYLLGIIGLGFMTTLLFYSVRKRLPALRNMGRLSTYFQIHMMLGLFGPVAILYHCNFSLGSLNSNVSLACALVVAGSGVAGRLIYTRIHYGLSDRRTTLVELRASLEDTKSDVSSEESIALVRDELRELESRLSGSGTGLFGSLGSSLSLSHWCRRTLRRARRELRRDDRARNLSTSARRARRRALKRHVAAVRAVGSLGAYERIFSLWHVLHLPLCFLLFVSAAVHVIAVNIY